jgi:hypothetical protein
MVNTVLPEFLKFYFFYPTEGGPPGRILLFTHRYPKKQRHAFWFCRDSAEDDVNPIRRPHLAPMESRLALEVATYLKERLNVRVWNARECCLAAEAARHHHHGYAVQRVHRE